MDPNNITFPTAPYKSPRPAAKKKKPFKPKPVHYIIVAVVLFVIGIKFPVLFFIWAGLAVALLGWYLFVQYPLIAKTRAIKKYAANNHMTYTPTANLSDLEGGIFPESAAPPGTYTDILVGLIHSLPFRTFTYDGAPPSSTDASAPPPSTAEPFAYTVMEAAFENPMPQFLLVARSDTIFRRHFSPQDPQVWFPGDFGNYFDLYSPPESEQGVYEIFTTEFREVLTTDYLGCDLELTGGRLYLYVTKDNFDFSPEEAAKISDDFRRLVDRVLPRPTNEVKLVGLIAGQGHFFYVKVHTMNLNVAWPEPGRYILAVSGGADSMVLLDLMARAAPERGYQLAAAHFDHGLRPDSREDRLFVQGAAKRYSLPFVHDEAGMGQGSEAAARAARHGWLETVRAGRGAAAVITAHHQDDLLETSLLNLARGSGRRGLAPMKSGRILHPLIGLTRAELRDYAAAHALAWREDPTNADISNPRNFLRHNLLPAAGPAWRGRYLRLIAELHDLNTDIDQRLQEMLAQMQALSGTPVTPTSSKTIPDASRDGKLLTGVCPPGVVQDPSGYRLPREVVQTLSLPELAELIVAAAGALVPGIELDRRLVGEITLFAKTGRRQRRRPLRQTLQVHIEPNCVRITPYKPAHTSED